MIGDFLAKREDLLLRGLLFDRSQVDRFSFRLRAFTQILSVPASSVHFDISRELGDFSVDSSEEEAFCAAAEAAEERGRPFLAFTRSYEGLLQGLDSEDFEATADPRLLGEIRCHCLIMLARDGAALQEANTLASAFASPEVPWEGAARDRALALRSALQRSHAEAVTQLNAWAAQTAQALGLERDDTL